VPQPSGRLQGEARSDLRRLSDGDFLAKWYFRQTPYVFRHSIQLFETWRQKLAQDLQLDVESVRVGGSAAAGISLSPTKRLRLFGPHSDIDLIVVSSPYFETAWTWMREARRRPNLTAIQRELIRDHMERLVFFETIACDRNLQDFPFGRSWFSAFETARAHPLLNGRLIKARIYRNREALVAYLTNGIQALRHNLGIAEDDNG
jgi:hypothetical protein